MFGNTLLSRETTSAVNLVTGPNLKIGGALLSQYRNRTNSLPNGQDLANLYFCRGWHRSGGSYAIQSPAIEDVLSMLRAPMELLGGLYTMERPVPSTGNADGLASIHFTVSIEEGPTSPPSGTLSFL
jgi:hypothetical protein